MNSEPFIEKMRAANMPEVAVKTFTRYYEKLVDGETGLIP